MTRHVMCCHLVYAITTVMINITACYRILYEWGFLKHNYMKGTHTLTHKLCLVTGIPIDLKENTKDRL